MNHISLTDLTKSPHYGTFLGFVTLDEEYCGGIGVPTDDGEVAAMHCFTAKDPVMDGDTEEECRKFPHVLYLRGVDNSSYYIRFGDYGALHSYAKRFTEHSETVDFLNDGYKSRDWKHHNS